MYPPRLQRTEPLTDLASGCWGGPTQITMDNDFDVESLLSGDIALGTLGSLKYQIGKDLRKLGKDTMNCVSWTVLAAGEAKALSLMK